MQMAPGRREIYNFPIDSLESTQPLLMKRKKLTKVDVQPVEGWRYAFIFISKAIQLHTITLQSADPHNVI